MPRPKKDVIEYTVTLTEDERLLIRGVFTTLQHIGLIRPGTKEGVTDGLLEKLDRVWADRLQSAISDAGKPAKRKPGRPRKIR